MVPSFKNHQTVKIVKKQKVKRWDAVVVALNGKDDLYLKRVVGLPGEAIAYKKGVLYVDGRAVADPFADNTADFDLESLFEVHKIPPESYLVLGDNRQNSKDSRTFGFIDATNIVGVVLEGEGT